MTQLNGTLFVRGLSLHVKLGWSAAEREKEQLVLLDLKLRFSKIPRACLTDELADTVCYDSLIKKTRLRLADKDFRLIEHLTHEIYHFIKSELGEQSSVNVSITKHPLIEGLTGGVCFSCSDEI